MYKTMKEEREDLIQRILILICFLIVFLFVGMISFHFLEGWTLKYSLYYSGVSLAMRGFSDQFPHTWGGVMFSLIYTFSGVGIVIFYCTSLIGYFISFYEKGFKNKLKGVFSKFDQRNQKKIKKDSWVNLRK